MMKKFISTMNKGFHMTFENGVTASVQWGAGNYCDNHFPQDEDFSFKNSAESDTAEVAALDSKDNFITRDILPDQCEYDDVIGWMSPEEVLEFLQKCREYNSNNN